MKPFVYDSNYVAINEMILKLLATISNYRSSNVINNF